MDPFKTVGAFSWAELVTPDPVKAKAFYGPLFGWAFNEMDMGGMAYHTVHLGQSDTQGVAGLMAPPPGSPPMPSHWGSYVTVADCDQTVEKAASLGGKCLVGPMDIPGVGRMAVLQDPQGAVINVIAYTMPAMPAA